MFHWNLFDPILQRTVVVNICGSYLCEEEAFITIVTIINNNIFSIIVISLK